MAFRKKINHMKKFSCSDSYSWQFFTAMMFWWIKLHEKSFYFGKKILN